MGSEKVATMKTVALCPSRCPSRLNPSQALTRSCGSLWWMRTRHAVLQRGWDTERNGLNAMISKTDDEYLLNSDIVSAIIFTLLGLRRQSVADQRVHLLNDLALGS